MKRAVATVTSLAGAATTEFVAVTLPGVPLPAEPGGLLLSHVIIDGFVNYTAGSTALTAVTLRVRRGTTIAGTQVGPSLVISAVQLLTYSIPFSVDDPLIQGTPPVVPGQVYVVTLQQTTSGGAGTVNYAVCTATTS